MALFSQRKGIKPLFNQPQVDSLDQDTRNQIWTALQSCVFGKWTGEYYDTGTKAVDELYRNIWSYHFKLPADSTPSSDPSDRRGAYQLLRKITLEEEWYEVFDLLEHTLKRTNQAWANDLTAFVNQIFERENVGYRIIGHEIVEITDPIETESIANALDAPRDSIKAHLGKALEFLSDRKAPDYRNSIKESISAVESTCQVISDLPNATLGSCLSRLKAKHPMHPAFEQALSKLYGYTSDASGIRHSLSDQSAPPTFADAKFMLVTCTAFINYLWTLAAETNLEV